MISLQVPSGTRPPYMCVAAWDTFQTLVETAKKLRVNITAYLQDRITRAYALPSLASLVAHQSERAVQLGAA